jgi:hypothetical protein
MKTTSLPVALTFLLLGGSLAFLPLTEEVTRHGHQILWALEASWFLWENRRSFNELWSGHLRTRR